MRGLPHKDRLVLEGSDEGRAETRHKLKKGVNKYEQSVRIANPYLL
jgi:hypothetical protein